jgi:hypothetical protein
MHQIPTLTEVTPMELSEFVFRKDDHWYIFLYTASHEPDVVHHLWSIACNPELNVTLNDVILMLGFLNDNSTFPGTPQ